MPFKTLNSLKPRLDLSDLSENPKPILRPKTAKATTPCKLKLLLFFKIPTLFSGCEIRAANPEAQCNCSFVHVGLWVIQSEAKTSFILSLGKKKDKKTFSFNMCTIFWFTLQMELKLIFGSFVRCLT